MQRPTDIRKPIAVMLILWVLLTFSLGTAGGGYAFLFSLAASFVAFAIGTTVEKHKIGKR